MMQYKQVWALAIIVGIIGLLVGQYVIEPTPQSPLTQGVVMPLMYGPDTTSQYHIPFKVAAMSPSDLEIVSYLTLQHLDIPYMNDVEKYVYHKALTTACIKSGITDPCLFYAQGIVESALNPRATGALGEIGIHQLRESTAWEVVDMLEWDREKLNESSFRKIEINVNLAAAYLAHLLDKHGDIERALSAYNGRSPEPSAYSKKVLTLRNKILEEINVRKSDLASEEVNGSTDSVGDTG